MKDCCDNCGGGKQKKSLFKKWFGYAVYTIIILIVLLALVFQIMGKEF
tara:strand:- start:786 stop:929 length:144 start_codon:yes stop_codon:yes gene_type:complete